MPGGLTKILAAMNQQPDKLFRDKLHNHEIPVSPEAWSRVSQNLRKKNRTALYLKLAASFLLVALATWLVLRQQTQPIEGQLALQDKPIHDNQVQDTGDVRDESVEQSINSTSETGTEPKTHESTPPEQNVPVPSTTKVKDKPIEKTWEKTEKPALAYRDTPAVNHSQDTAVQPEINTTESVAVENESPKAPARNRNMTIVFSIDEVNQKYLAKNNTPEATSDDEQSSGLKKLLDKAHDLKHGDDLIGSLRQMKNEILAVNFKNERQTPENH
jgi:ABC-type nickel/cobalt efflux system permease component RcnA